MIEFRPLSFDHLARAYGFLEECEDEAPYVQRYDLVHTQLYKRAGVYQTHHSCFEEYDAREVSFEDAVIAKIDAERAGQIDPEDEEALNAQWMDEQDDAFLHEAFLARLEACPAGLRACAEGCTSRAAEPGCDGELAVAIEEKMIVAMRHERRARRAA